MILGKTIEQANEEALALNFLTSDELKELIATGLTELNAEILEVPEAQKEAVKNAIDSVSGWESFNIDGDDSQSSIRWLISKLADGYKAEEKLFMDLRSDEVFGLPIVSERGRCYIELIRPKTAFEAEKKQAGLDAKKKYKQSIKDKENQRMKSLARAKESFAYWEKYEQDQEVLAKEAASILS
ncbi:hypothetical protein FM038_001585 [Shewanella eurypsychrophilus]|uniref:Uncharacterized protein n=1 Tax=Shewanella eurypsychrophilus TaxID=2593656 RepID=A0ABX6V325_9GAMM|nr:MULTISPECIES: hypothetical protein [Shewanella]QFU20691.1 hypothetical protein FS418_01565 [Shewanella sp. YLB-09]QFU20971.1 hypothetical protein FS418_03175 [Shewanella sp. YLB-09]QPG56259.1 hypothetical protein FM038_001585 [Shewanella eurypsychrophilus]